MNPFFVRLATRLAAMIKWLPAERWAPEDCPGEVLARWSWRPARPRATRASTRCASAGRGSPLGQGQGHTRRLQQRLSEGLCVGPGEAEDLPVRPAEPEEGPGEAGRGQGARALARPAHLQPPPPHLPDHSARSGDKPDVLSSCRRGRRRRVRWQRTRWEVGWPCLRVCWVKIRDLGARRLHFAGAKTTSLAQIAPAGAAKGGVRSDLQPDT